MKILECYPFKLTDPTVELIEGFSEYDGNLKDKPGDLHNGIDYVRRKGDKFVSFEVYSCHDGETHQGLSKTWGKFVTIKKMISKNLRYYTIYAHLSKVNPNIPLLPENKDRERPKGLKVRSGFLLGRSGITGRTNRLIQLHFELHKIKGDKREKIDPYGLNLRFSSGKYPQPGQSLSKLSHYWTSNNPLLKK